MSSDERGFTLVELLMAMLIGGIIMGAALTMLTRSQLAERDISDRTDAAQRGRFAIEAVGRPLRSMTCLSTGAQPILAASDDSITFYADVDNDLAYDPEQWRLSAVRDGTGALTGIRQERWRGVATPVGTTAPNENRILIDRISARTIAGTPQPLFSYFAYANAAADTPTALPTGTQAAPDLQRIAQIDIGFNSQPGRDRKASDVSTEEVTSVYARTVRRDAALPTYDCTA